MKFPEDNRKQSVKDISRRALVLGAVQLAVVGGLVARMRYLQVDQAENFRVLAEENRINVNLLAPARGTIFDRDGRPLALNTPNYRILMVRENAGDVDRVLDNLQKLIDVDPFDLSRARKQIAERARFTKVPILENMSWADFAKVAANLPALPGIETDSGLSRVYPLGATFAHVVGYVGPVSDYDLSKIENPDPLLKLPRFQLGKWQVEAKLEETLRGAAGTQQIEVNA
ncbi:MAG: penicillin-binding protein 2, partial [Pseudomonadota bacterium]